MKRRTLILLLGGASSGAMSVGTSAFSGVEAERDVEVNVVKDKKAYLGLRNLTTNEDRVVKSATETNVVQITNKFTSDLNLTISLNGRGEAVDQVTVGDQLEVGEKKQVDLTPGEQAFVAVRCETDETARTSLSLAFTGDAGGTTVNKQRVFKFRCESASESTSKIQVEFMKNGNVIIHIDDDKNISAKAYIRGSGKSGRGSVGSIKSGQQTTGAELGPKDFGWENNGDEIIGIGIEGIGVFTRAQAGSDGFVSEEAVLNAGEAFSDETE
ncbi:hypothetical protein [Halorubrum coriense]|uniref:hypothetical protein n=1 Tax=Halorubrum coriense TaxID=64713 RepID=UPI0012687B10|nr:hypothetical protein [Halorubrum coriense]